MILQDERFVQEPICLRKRAPLQAAVAGMETAPRRGARRHSTCIGMQAGIHLWSVEAHQIYIYIYIFNLLEDLDWVRVNPIKGPTGVTTGSPYQWLESQHTTSAIHADNTSVL